MGERKTCPLYFKLTSDAAQVTFGEPEWGEWSDAEPQADPITPVK